MKAHGYWFIGGKTAGTVHFLAGTVNRKRECKKTRACVWSEVRETKAQWIFLSFHAWSFPYVPLALLPIHHISLWARQLSGAEAYSQFSSPSNCTKYSNSSVKLGQGKGGGEGEVWRTGGKKASKRQSHAGEPCQPPLSRHHKLLHPVMFFDNLFLNPDFTSCSSECVIYKGETAVRPGCISVALKYLK